MRLTIEADEITTLLRSLEVLPSSVGPLSLGDESVVAPVEVGSLPGLGAAVRLAAAFVGPVALRVRNAGLRGGTWSLAVDLEPELRLPGIDGIVASVLRDALEPLGADAIVEERPAEGAASGARVGVDIALGRLLDRGVGSLVHRRPENGGVEARTGGPADVRPSIDVIRIRPDGIHLEVDLGF